MTMKTNGDPNKENCPSPVTTDNKDNTYKDHEQEVQDVTPKDQPTNIAIEKESNIHATADTPNKPIRYSPHCYRRAPPADMANIDDSKASTSGTHFGPPLPTHGLLNLATPHPYIHRNSLSFPPRTSHSTHVLSHSQLKPHSYMGQLLPPHLLQQHAMNAFEETEDYENEMVEEEHGEDMPIQYAYGEQFRMVYSMGDEPDRKDFLDELFDFMQSQGTPINRVPIMAKNNLDLYKLFKLVVERGGILQVVNKKLWREITRGLRLPATITSAAFTLRTQYCRYLYAFECKKYNFSKPAELQAAVENNRREGKKNSYMFDVGQGALPVGVFPAQGAGNSVLFNQAMLSHMLASSPLAKQMMGSPGFQLPVRHPPQLSATHPVTQQLPGATSLHIPHISSIRQFPPTTYTPTCAGSFRDSSPPIHSQMLKDSAFTATHLAAQRRPSPFNAAVMEPKMIKLESISPTEPQPTNNIHVSRSQTSQGDRQPSSINGICQRQKSGGDTPYVKMSIDVDGVIYNGVLHPTLSELQ